MNTPTRTRKITCALPKAKPVYTSASLLAQQMGEHIAQARQKASPVDAALDFLRTYAPSIPDPERIANRIGDRIVADPERDSERQMAIRASLATAMDEFQEGAEVVNWLPGLTVRTRLGNGTLTGSVCESCRVNPEVYGETGSGIACLNSAECGYRYCD